MNKIDEQARKLSIEELKKFCIETKIVTKNKKINPRIKKDDKNCLFVEEQMSAPLKVAIDILFMKNGEVPRCNYCGDELDMYSLSNYKPINYIHKSCSVKSKNDKIDWNSAVNKRKATCTNLYGAEYYFDYDKMVNQSRKTKADRYGNKNYVNPEKMKQTKKERYGNENYRNDEKIKATNKERYGADNPFGSKQIISKIDEKMQREYGGRGFASTVISADIRDTIEYKFGVSNAMQNSDVSLKSRNTKRKLYYGDDLHKTLTEDLDKQYKQYFENNKLSITKLAESIGVDRNTLSRAFQREGFEVLDRRYNCSTSAGEDYLINIIKSIDPSVEIIRNTRKIIEPKEIDIWLPQYNLGIEYHGSYWHQENKVGEKHRDKAVLAQKIGIRLIQIFDYELVEKTDKIISVIKNAMGICEKKIFARDCQITKLDVKTARTFCEENHLQNYSPAKINYGLIHKTLGLVQLMSFSSPRFSRKNQWEIIRLCTKRNFIVLGGTEKLWKNFIKEYEPSDVITYADARFFSGSTYNRIGFEYKDHSGSGYIWNNGVSKLTRHQTRKSNLLDENKKLINKSENQIMSTKGFYKILDAGNFVYEWRKQN